MRTNLLLIVILGMVCWPSFIHAQTDPVLRGALERSYMNWRDAMLRGDAQAWAGSITRYRQTVIRNSIVSDRRVFPDAVFSTGTQPPALGGLSLLEAQAVGPTAHLVYFGKIDLGQDRELLRDHILKLKFYQEDGVWKYDSNRIVRLDSAPEVRKSLQEGKRPDFLDSPEYTPPGVLPEVPPLCRVPDFRAGFKLQSFGFETTIRMNGIAYEPVEDGLDQQLLIGGLVKGKNEITLNIKPVKLPEGEKAELQLRVYLLEDDPGKPGKEVLRWVAPASAVPASITLPIEIAR
jgi:hypothetical protein